MSCAQARAAASCCADQAPRSLCALAAEGTVGIAGGRAGGSLPPASAADGQSVLEGKCRIMLQAHVPSRLAYRAFALRTRWRRNLVWRQRLRRRPPSRGHGSMGSPSIKLALPRMCSSRTCLLPHGSGVGIPQARADIFVMSTSSFSFVPAAPRPGDEIQRGGDASCERANPARCSSLARPYVCACEGLPAGEGHSGGLEPPPTRIRVDFKEAKICQPWRQAAAHSA